MPWHTIHDNEKIRFELTRHAYGVWDWMKNHDPVIKEKCRTMALDFIGQIPGKRETRRVRGRHLFNENEVQARIKYPDEVAYGGWRIDLHTPGGLLAPSSEPSAAAETEDDNYGVMGSVGPYGIPLSLPDGARCGQPIPCGTLFLHHARRLRFAPQHGDLRADGSGGGDRRCPDARSRHRPACAGRRCRKGRRGHQVLQQALLRDGCFLPNVANEDPADLARDATATGSSSALLYGLSPDEAAPNQRMWTGSRAVLDKKLAQNVWCSGGRLDRLELCLDNVGPESAQVPVRLVKVESVFDYRIGGGGVLAEGRLTVPSGNARWAGWDVSLDGLSAGWLRLEIEPTPGVYCVQPLGILTGHNAYGHLSSTRLRPWFSSLAFKVSPPQAAFGPEQVLTGVTRPHASPQPVAQRSESGPAPVVAVGVGRGAAHQPGRDHVSRPVVDRAAHRARLLCRAASREGL